MKERMARSESERERPERDVLEILRETMDREGAELFSAILAGKFGTEAPSEPRARLSLKQVAARAKDQLGIIARETLSAPPTERPLALASGQRNSLARLRDSATGVKLRNGAGRGLRLSLNSASYLSGLCLGLGLPDLHFKFYKRDKPKNAITLHSAPFLSMDLTLRWMSAVCLRAQAHEEATESHRAALRAVGQILDNYIRGMSTGVSAQFLRKQSAPEANEVGIPLEEPEYRMAEAVFSALLAQTRGR